MKKIFQKKYKKYREILFNYEIKKNPSNQINDQLIKSFALLAAQEEIQAHQNNKKILEAYEENLLLKNTNESLFFCQSIEKKAIFIPAKSIILGSETYRTAYDHYHNNIKLESLKQTFNLIRITLNASDLSGPIRIHTKTEIIKEIFQNKPEIQLGDYKLKIDIYNFKHLLNAPEYFNSFSIFGAKPGKITLNIPIKNTLNCSKEDFKFNHFVAHNIMVHQETIYIDGPKEYLIDLKNFKIHKTLGLFQAKEKYSHFQDNINGWFYTKKNNQLFINITPYIWDQMKQQEQIYSLYFEVINNDIKKEDLLFQDLPCSIKVKHFTNPINNPKNPIYFMILWEKYRKSLDFYLLQLQQNDYFSLYSFKFSYKNYIYPGKIAGLSIPVIKKKAIIKTNAINQNLFAAISFKLRDNYSLCWQTYKDISSF